MARPTYRTLPPAGGNAREIAERVNGALAGKLNCTGELTLPDGESSVTVDHPRASIYSVVMLVPRNISARSLSWHIVTGTQQFTVEADAAASGDAEFDFALLG